MEVEVKRVDVMLKGFVSEIPFPLRVSMGGFPLWEEEEKREAAI